MASGQKKQEYRVEGVMGQQLDTTVKVMERKMNELHEDGYDVDEPMPFGNHFLIVGQLQKVKARGKK